MNSCQVNLVVDWCSYEAAKYAVEKWHYSGVMPAGKTVKLGVWENGEFIGAVVFGRGANNHIGSRYGLEQVEMCELVRVALRLHRSPVSQIISMSLKLLKGLNDGLRLVISYADPEQNHYGGIYQAAGWLYVRPSNAQRALRVTGQFLHKRAASARWGTASPEKIKELVPGLDVKYGPKEWKYTYLYPLDRAMRRQIAPLAQPYPKRAGEVSKVTRPATGGEGQVRALPSALEPA